MSSEVSPPTSGQTPAEAARLTPAARRFAQSSGEVAYQVAPMTRT